MSMESDFEAILNMDLDQYNDPVYTRLLLLWIAFKGESDVETETIVERLCPNLEHWRMNDITKAVEELIAADVLVESGHEFYRVNMGLVDRNRYSQSQRLSARHKAVKRRKERGETESQAAE